jgi:hypothetical protein
LLACEGIGMAASRVDERILASQGLLTQATVEFETNESVSYAGVLFALPALLTQGLLDKADKVFKPLSNGYYSLRQVLLIVSFMALCRIKNPEQLKNYAPGELGKLLGLDRCPEVKCLRAKINAIVNQDKTEQYQQELSSQWINQQGTLFFYSDGHVRVYNGNKATLPKKYVARQKLCLTGTTEFWFNDEAGSPISVFIGDLSERLKDGILETIPQLIEHTRTLVSRQELEDNPKKPRFNIIFDREVYEPAFFKKLWEDRIAVITYRKNVKDKWDENDFKEHDYQYKSKNVRLNICCKDIELDGCPMREVRVLTETGHQTAVITTNFELPVMEIAIRMFKRWNQENCFRYMIMDFDIDHLIEYGYETLNKELEVVNPEYARLSYMIKKKREREQRLNAQLLGKLLELSDLPLENAGPLERFIATIQQKVMEVQTEIKQLVDKRSPIKSRVKLGEMPEEKRYNRLIKGSKLFMNIIKIIAYRAETALFNNLPGIYANAEKEGRMLLKEIFTTPADIIPNYQKQTLTIRLHPLSTHRAYKAAEELFKLLNQSEIIYPDTKMKLIYQTFQV